MKSNHKYMFGGLLIFFALVFSGFFISKNKILLIGNEKKDTDSHLTKPATNLKSSIETFNPHEKQGQLESKQASRASNSNDGEDMDCENIIFFENGQEYCKDETTIIVPSGDEERLREAMVTAAFEFYRENKYISFLKSHLGNIILIQDSAPLSEKNRTGDTYWADLRDEEGKVIGIIEMSIKGRLNGEEYLQLSELDPKGSAFTEKGPWESNELSIEGLQKRESYKYENFPPVTETMASSFLRDFMTEQKVLNDVASTQMVGYGNLYDYDGRPFAANNIFYKFVVTDKNGNEKPIFVNMMDGRVIDDNYIGWLTDINRRNVENSTAESIFSEPEEESSAPQQPRL